MTPESKRSKPSFCEWFDVNKIEHINAYVYLQKHGNWPEGFIPEHIFMEPVWQALLVFKLANAWVDHISDKCWHTAEKYGMNHEK